MQNQTTIEAAPENARITEDQAPAIVPEQTEQTPAAEADDDTMSLEELAGLCLERANMYSFVSRLCFDEVDQETFDTLKETLYPISTPDRNINEGGRLIATYISNSWSTGVSELAIDFVSTFIGHGGDGHSAAYPYESTYTSNRRLLMQGSRDEVLAIYKSVGLGKAEGFRYAEDHIFSELEFMQILCNRAAEALQDGDQAKAEQIFTTQLNFLEDHLLNWVPMLTREMRRFAKTDFYRGLSHLLMGYLENDKAFLEQLLEIKPTDASAAHTAPIAADDDFQIDVKGSLFDEEE